MKVVYGVRNEQQQAAQAPACNMPPQSGGIAGLQQLMVANPTAVFSGRECTSLKK